MTSWIDWRPEPIVAVPDVWLVGNVVKCDDLNCKDIKAESHEDALIAAQHHADWHRNGCPE